MSLQPGVFALLSVSLALAVGFELWRKKVPWWHSGMTLAVALSLRFFEEGMGEGVDSGVWSGLLGAGLAFFVLGLFSWWSGGLGRHEVFLVGAVGGALGFPLGAAALVFISLAGALEGLAMLLWRPDLRAALRTAVARRGAAEQGQVEPGIPYSVAIALGTVWTMWWDAGQH